MLRKMKEEQEKEKDMVVSDNLAERLLNRSFLVDEWDRL